MGLDEVNAEGEQRAKMIATLNQLRNVIQNRKSASLPRGCHRLFFHAVHLPGDCDFDDKQQRLFAGKCIKKNPKGWNAS